jgi:hypothetical protein
MLVMPPASVTSYEIQAHLAGIDRAQGCYAAQSASIHSLIRNLVFCFPDACPVTHPAPGPFCLAYGHLFLGNYFGATGVHRACSVFSLERAPEDFQTANARPELWFEAFRLKRRKTRPAFMLFAVVE